MEGTHSILQLHKPIMELCYVSFYLPRGNVRGFTYKRCVTRDKARTCFDNCYRIREETEAAEQKDPPYESFTEALKKNTTQSILTELYKLTAAKDRLLVQLLHTIQNPNSIMGNQDGKFQDIPGGYKFREDETSDRMDFQESYSASVERKVPLPKGKKIRRFSRRKESIEEFVNKKIKWKGQAGLEAGVAQDRDRTSSARLSLTGSMDSLSRPRLQSVENKDSCIPGHPVNSAHVKESTYGNLGMQSPELEIGSSLSVYDNDVFSDFSLLSHSDSLFGELHGVMQIIQEPNSAPIMQGSESPRSSNCFNDSEIISSQRNHHTVVAKVQEIRPCVQRVVTNYNYLEDEGKEKRCDNVTLIHSDLPDEFRSKVDVLTLHEPVADHPGKLQGNERNYLVDRVSDKNHCFNQDSQSELQINNDPLMYQGFVNKSLLKVVQSDSVEETEYWLGQLGQRSETSSMGFSLPKQGNWLSEPLISAMAPYQSSNIKTDEKTPAIPSLVCDVLSNSYLSSNIHKQTTPVLSPVSSHLPSPQLHHRILPLPSQLSEEDVELSGGEVNPSAPLRLPKESLLHQTLGAKAKVSTTYNLGPGHHDSDVLWQKQYEDGRTTTLRPNLPPPGGGDIEKDATKLSFGFPCNVFEGAHEVCDVKQQRADHLENQQGKPDRNVLHLSLEIHFTYKVLAMVLQPDDFLLCLPSLPPRAVGVVNSLNNYLLPGSCEAKKLDTSLFLPSLDDDIYIPQKSPSKAEEREISL